MKTENKNSERDLNANPESKLNTNKPVSKPDQFPESQQVEGKEKKDKKKKKDSDIELLVDDVKGTVSDRGTSSSPRNIAGVSDLDKGMSRSKRR